MRVEEKERGRQKKRAAGRSPAARRICRFAVEAAAGLVLAAALFLTARYAGLTVAGASVRIGKTRPVVILDAGHGGNDPGKVGVNGTLEKDINLALVKRLETYLEQSDVEVVLTREEDAGLYGETDRNRKAADMKNRCRKIEEAKPDLAVSIHQNSYRDEAVSGGQVFYYEDSAQGKRLAQTLQERLGELSGGENRRQAKADQSYYLLLHVSCPIVIVECGFLSNWKEAKLLSSEEYQDQLAWALHMGIMEYLNRL